MTMLIFTEAPVGYDYGTTNELARLILDRRDQNATRTREPRVLRVVDVVGENDERTEFLTRYQADRYRSGLYFTTTDPDDAGVYLQLHGGRGATALLRGYATVGRLCDECGDDLHPTFDPTGGTCGSCREARDRRLVPDIPSEAFRRYMAADAQGIDEAQTGSSNDEVYENFLSVNGHEPDVIYGYNTDPANATLIWENDVFHGYDPDIPDDDPDRRSVKILHQPEDGYLVMRLREDGAEWEEVHAAESEDAARLWCEGRDLTVAQ